VAVLTAAGVTALNLPAAEAAASGQYPVSSTAIALSQPADALLGRVTPAANADTAGMFGPQVAWPLIPVHVALAPNGHLVSYGSPQGVARQGGLSYDDWNPALGTVAGAHAVTAGMGGYDSFCNALQTLPDGRILMVGGNSDGKMSMSTMYYDPATKVESMGPLLNRQRWYASVMRLTDDRILVLGGGNYYNTGAYRTPNDNSGVATTPEIGDGSGAWSLLSGADSATAFGAQDNRWWYPRAFNAPDGNVFGVSANQIWRLTTAGTGAVTSLGTIPNSIGVSGAAVMYAPGKLLLAGGGQAFNEDNVTATNAATTIDIADTTPVVTSIAPMANKRNWLNLTVLPNGEVLANGGTIVGTAGTAGNAVYATETWNPATGAWRTGASAQRIRTYHSTSVLMPSGAVFTGGGGIPGPEDNLNAEIYYPSYLFAKKADGTVGWANRPSITSLAGSMTWGGDLTLGLGDARTISSVSLINAAQETHSVNQDQRRIPLTFTQSGDSITATVPAGKDTVPPGSYLLQTVDSAGVPSPSQLVTIRNDGAGSVTVYEADASAGQVGANYTRPAGTVGLTVGSMIGLEPANFLGYRVRHANYAGRIAAVTTASNDVDKQDSSFVVRAGLASATGVSFEALNLPGYFLRVENGAAFLRKNDGSAAFAGTATFLAKTGLSGQNTSFAVYSNQNLYLRHQNFGLYAQASDGTDGFRADASFRVRGGLGITGAVAPLTPGSADSLEAANFPGYLVRHRNYAARIDPINGTSAALAKQDSSFTVRTGLASTQGISFESKNYPGYFLKVEKGATFLRKNDGTPDFAANATFLSVPGLAGRNLSLALYANQSVYLRHQNYVLAAQVDDGSEQFGQDATFVPRAALG
jgi:hypothetical protein